MLRSSSAREVHGCVFLIAFFVLFFYSVTDKVNNKVFCASLRVVSNCDLVLKHAIVVRGMCVCVGACARACCVYICCGVCVCTLFLFCSLNLIFETLFLLCSRVHE